MPKRYHVIPAPSVVDRDWAHQVALPDDICTDRNLTKITKLCQDAGTAYQIRHVEAVWANGKYEDYRLHRFTDAAAAQVFRDHFRGDMFDRNAIARTAKYVASGVAPVSTGVSSISDRSACPRSCVTRSKPCAVASPDISHDRKSIASIG